MRAHLVSFGSIKGGIRRNVIGGSAELSGIIRAENTEMCKFIGVEIEKAAKNIAEIYGCSAQAIFTEGYPPLINDAGVTEMLRDAVDDYNKKSIMDEIKITEVEDFSLTVDDICILSRKSTGHILLPWKRLSGKGKQRYTYEHFLCGRKLYQSRNNGADCGCT